MPARIPTNNIDARFRPLAFLHDRRLQQLEPAYFKAFVNLMMHAVFLNAENSSKFIDGAFDCATALAMVPGLDDGALASFVSVELVVIIDESRMKIAEFLISEGGYQSSHAELVKLAEKMERDRNRKRCAQKTVVEDYGTDPTETWLAERDQSGWGDQPDYHPRCSASGCPHWAVAGSEYCVLHSKESAHA